MVLGRGGCDVEISVDGEALPGYRALPAAGRGAGVLVLHEAFGLVDHTRDVCDRLAREGFVALAPDLYRGRDAETLEDALGLAASLESERVGQDLEAAVGALVDDDAVDGRRVGVVGFCMGGHLALLAAARSARVGAAVDFYGFHPGLPLDAEKIEASVLCVFAEKDEFIPAERVDLLRRALERAGVRVAFHLEPGVGHAFMNDTRPDHHAAAAAVAGWNRLLSFLRAELP